VIVRWPEVPAVEGKLSVPRPAVFLIGSYTTAQSAGGWYEQAARYLERSAGAVFYGVLTGPWREDFHTWFYHWLDRAEVAAIWIEGPTWSQFEIGMLIGSYARSGRPELVIGVHHELERLRRAFELVIEHFGLELLIHDDRATTIHAARDVLRRFR
jgi:hypothetical protein